MATLAKFVLPLERDATGTGCGRRPPIARMAGKAPQLEGKLTGWTFPPAQPVHPMPQPKPAAIRPPQNLVEVKGGWPGVKGRVYVGVPVVDRFGEVVVVERNAGGYFHSRSLGKVH